MVFLDLAFFEVKIDLFEMKMKIITPLVKIRMSKLDKKCLEITERI